MQPGRNLHLTRAVSPVTVGVGVRPEARIRSQVCAAERVSLVVYAGNVLVIQGVEHFAKELSRILSKCGALM